MMKYAGIILLFLSVAVGLGCSRQPGDPGYQVDMLTDMINPVPYEAFRQEMRLPVEGTVYRGSLIKTEATNPVPFSKEVLSRGEFVFSNYCLICHGEAGDGDGPLIPKYPNPPAFTSNRVMKLTSREIFDVITNGKRDMPSHAGQIDAIDRWKLVYYIEKLQGKIK